MYLRCRQSQFLWKLFPYSIAGISDVSNVSAFLDRHRNGNEKIFTSDVLVKTVCKRSYRFFSARLNSTKTCEFAELKVHGFYFAIVNIVSAMQPVR